MCVFILRQAMPGANKSMCAMPVQAKKGLQPGAAVCHTEKASLITCCQKCSS